MKSSTKTKSSPHSKLVLSRASGVSLSLSVLLAVATVAVANLYGPASASPCSTTGASPVQCNTTFTVNVQEALSVSISTPSTWASGTPQYDSSSDSWSTDFLRNTVSLSVASNNETGFTATMYATDTSLTNTADNTKTLPTMSSSETRGSFTADHWGYSLDTTGDDASTSTYTYNNKAYNETTAGNSASYYHPVPTSSAPATVLTAEPGSSSTYSGTRDIYFGSKASLSTAAGTYAGTVVISVVTGVVNDGDSSAEPVPTNPATPTDDVANDSTATYSSTYNRTVYTTTSSDSTTQTNTTTAKVTTGNTTNNIPLGVTESTIANVSEGSSLTTGLAVAASVAAASGIFFFIVAKRRDDDDDEEEV